MEKKVNSEGQKILDAIGLELLLGLTTWEKILQSCKDFNRKHFTNREE